MDETYHTTLSTPVLWVVVVIMAIMTAILVAVPALAYAWQTRATQRARELGLLPKAAPYRPNPADRVGAGPGSAEAGRSDTRDASRIREAAGADEAGDTGQAGDAREGSAVTRSVSVVVSRESLLAFVSGNEMLFAVVRSGKATSDLA